MADGNVEYDVTLGANTKGIEQSINRTIKAMESLESSMKQATSGLEAAFKKMDTSAKKSGKTSQDAMRNIERSITPSIGKLEDLQASYQKVRNEAQRMGKTDSFEKAGRAMQAYQKQLKDGFESSKHMGEATSRLSKELQVVQQETNKYQQMMVKMQKSLGSAEREVQTLTARMVAMGESEEAITPLNKALQQYRQDLKAAGGDVLAQTKAQETYKTSVNAVTSRMEQNRKSIRGAATDQSAFTQQLQNSTKAVQLALGPLSGIASRITAFTSLVRSNTVGIAAFTASIVGLVVATNRIISVGIEYERQLLLMDSAIEATGRSAETSSSQIDSLARSIADATLTSASQARRALNVLMTFQGVSVSMFEDITLAAQGVSSIFGGDIVASTRLLARAIEQPANSLDSLRRVGIQFTDSQKSLIRSLEETGRVAQAQGVIMERLEVFQEGAKGEAAGLAGQIDALGDNMTRLTEDISKEIQANERLSEAYAGVNATLVDVINNKDMIVTAIDAVSGVISGLTGVAQSLARNFETVAAVLTGVVVASIVKVTAATLRYVGVNAATAASIGNVVTAFRSKQAAATAATTATIGATTAVRGLIAALGPLGLGLTAASLAYYALSRGGNESTRATERLTKAQQALETTQSVNEQGSLALATATGRVTEEMVKQADVIAQTYQRDLATALNGAGDMFNAFSEEISNSLTETQAIVNGISVDTFKTGQAREELSQFKESAKEAFNAVKEGGDVSSEAIESLKEEAERLGAGVDFIKQIEQLKQLSDNANIAADSAKTMHEMLADGSIDSTAFLKGLRDSFGDAIYDFDQFEDRMREMDFSYIIDNTAAAERAVNEFFDGQLENLHEQGLAEDELRKRIAYTNQERDKALDSIEGFSKAMQDSRLKDYRDDLSDISREFELMNAASDEARETLERTFAIEDRIHSFKQSLMDAAKSPEDITRALIELNVVSVQAGQGLLFTAAAIDEMANGSGDLEARLEGLNSKLHPLVSSLVDFNTSTTRSTRSTRRSSSSTNDAKKEEEDRAKSVESLMASIESLTLEQDRAEKSLKALQKGGVKALNELEKSFGIDDTVQSLVDEFEELDKKGKRLAIQKLDKYFDDVSISADNYAKYLRKLEEEKVANVEETERLIEAEEKLKGVVDDLIESSEDLEDRLMAMTDFGISAAQIKSVRDFTKAFNSASVREQQQQLERLRQQFPDLIWEVETFEQSIDKAFRQNNAVEEWADTVEDVGNRIGSTLEDTIKGALDGSINSFSDAADRLKDMMKQLLIDLAYQAVLEPIVVGIQADVMGGMTGQSQGFGGTSGGFGNVVGAVKEGFGSIAWGGSGGAQSYSGTGFANAATSGTGATGFMGGSTSNFAGATGLASAGAGMAGGYVGTSAAESLTGRTANSNYGATAGSLIGTYFGGPIGAAIGGGIGGIADSLFGSGRKSFDFDFEQGTQSGVFGDRESALGQFGISSFSDFKLEQQEGLNEMLTSIEQFDNTLANAAIPERVDAMKESIEGFTYGSPEGLFEERLRAIIDGSGAMMEEALLEIVDPDALAKAFEGVLQLEAAGQSLGKELVAGIEDELERYSGTDRFEGAIVAMTNAANAAGVLVSGVEHLNLQFDKTADGAIHAAGELANMAGGVENLANLQSSYYDKYFTEEEKKARIHEDLAEVFSDLNMTMPDSISGFRDIVESLDLNSEAGRKTYTQLMQVAGAFADTVPALEDAGEAAKDFSQAISKRASLDKQLLTLQGDTQALRELELDSLREIEGWQEKGLVSKQKEIWAIEDNIAARNKEKEAARNARREAETYWNAVNSSLKSISGWVDNFMGTQQSPTLNLGSAAEDFRKQFEKAASGDRDALSNITQYADRFLNAGELMYASGKGYQDIQDEVLGKLNSLPDPESDVEYLARRFDESITNNLPKTIEDVIKSLEYEIDSLIRFAADATHLPQDLRDIINQQAHDIEATVDVILGSNVSQDAMKLALETANDLTATIKAIVSSDASEDAMRLGLENTNRINSLIKAIVSSDADQDAIMLGLETANNLTTTVDAIFSNSLSDSVRKMALGTNNAITTAVDAVFSRDLNSQVRKLALGNYNNLTTTVSAIVSSDASEAAMELGLDNANYLLATVDTILSSGASKEAVELGLNATNSLTTTVEGIFSRSLNSNVRKLALGSTNSITTAVNAAYSRHLNSQVRKLALGNANSLTTTVNAILDSGIREDAMAMALQNTNDIATNITATLDPKTPESIRALALGWTRGLDRVINASISKNTDADAMALGLNRTNNMNVILSGLLSRDIPKDVLKLALGSGNDFITTLEASLEDGKLSEREMKLIDSDAESLVRELEVSGALRLTKDQWAVINAVDGHKRLDLLADVAFKDADIKNLKDIEGNTKALDQANYDGMKVSLGRNHNPSGLIDMAYNWGTKWGNMGAPAFSSAGGGFLNYQPAGGGSSSGGSSGGSATPTGTTNDSRSALQSMSINDRAALYMKRYPDLQDYYSKNKASLHRTIGGKTEIDFAKWHWIDGPGQTDGANRFFADGGAFTNSIVKSPTNFNIGQMGEAGPEAIMPLTNVGGQMGVRAILPESSPTMDFALASAIRELKNEVRELRRDSNERLDRVEEHTAASVNVQQEGFIQSINEQRKGNSYLEDQTQRTRLEDSK